jgi:hypothetical protein
MINTSMPRLVNVRRTSGDPEQRATELSAATGIPTRFLVAYKEFFEDYQAAEQRAHTMLSLKGYRSSSTRKKALKEAIASGCDVSVYQPGLGVIPDNDVVYLEGPHYPKPHTWYATGTMRDGKLVAVK